MGPAGEVSGPGCLEEGYFCTVGPEGGDLVVVGLEGGDPSTVVRAGGGSGTVGPTGGGPGAAGPARLSVRRERVPWENVLREEVRQEEIPAVLVW